MEALIPDAVAIICNQLNDTATDRLALSSCSRAMQEAVYAEPSCWSTLRVDKVQPYKSCRFRRAGLLVQTWMARRRPNIEQLCLTGQWPPLLPEPPLPRLRELSLVAGELTAEQNGRIAAHITLESLTLRSYRLRQLPPELGGLKLRYLDLSTNPLTGDLSALGHLKFLTTLRMEGSQCERLPAAFSRLPVLRVLLSGRSFGCCYAVTRCCGLRKVLKRSCHIEDWRSLGTLKALRVLSLEGCNLRRLPPELALLSQLQELVLAWNGSNALGWQLVQNWEPLGALKALRVLDLQHCNVQAVPTVLASLELQELNLSFNPITSWEYVRELKALRRLKVQGCGLLQVPAEVAFLGTLQELDLSQQNARLRSGWVHLTGLRGLTRLALHDNGLRTVPALLKRMIATLPSLQILMHAPVRS